MRILRPDGRRRLDEQLLDACVDRDAVSPRCLVVLAVGDVRPETLEPFATLEVILGDAFDRELRLVVTDGWRAQFWAEECGQALDLADPERGFDFAPTAGQQARALEQRVEDGRLEVLFVEGGRLVGSALSLVARGRTDGRPLALNAKIAAMDLLVAAREAFTANPRAVELLVRDAREALGLPAGPMTSVREVRRARGEDVPPPTVSIDQVGNALRALSARATPAAPTPTQPAILRVGPPLRPAGRGSPATRPAPAVSAAPVAAAQKATPAERHALEDGRTTCSRCGKAGKALEEPCGKQDLGRIGFLEFD